MEYYKNELEFLEELLGLRENIMEEKQYCPNNQYPFNTIEGIDYSTLTNNINFSSNNNIPSSSMSNYSANSLEDIDFSLFFDRQYPYAPFGNPLSPPEFSAVDSTGTNFDTQTRPNYCAQEPDNYYSIPSFLDDEDYVSTTTTLFGNGLQNNLDIGAECKMEVEPVPENPIFSFGSGFDQNERKSKVKRLNGQPSKNLMAERRRRKRLNDRLSMLRSVVPKISKMDRTSILGDTIDYMKELLERINNLQEEMDFGPNELSLMSVFKDVKPNESFVRNSPKFDVERRNEDTKIEISCGSKPGLLLSTVTTLEALGLEIQQCVISCFNEFALQASCSEELKKRSILDSEDIKQALVRNAGYGGRCL